MSKYDTYFLLDSGEVTAYIREKLPGYFRDGTVISCTEIGDGNLNYVFQLRDEDGVTLIVKQAGEVLRIASSLNASIDRGRIEAGYFTAMGKLAKNFVPKIYLYDEVMRTIIMEEMTEHAMMRTALMQHETFPLFADQITTYLIQTLLGTSDLVVDHQRKKAETAKFINPSLCHITEDLVFSEPYLNYNHRNEIFPVNQEFVKREIYEDKKLHLEVAKLKFEFMNHPQALIHGDLHTGSIFINKEHTFIFDAEFAFYGPIGYDLGVLIANLFFAYCHGEVTLGGSVKSEFCSWILSTIVNIVDLFREKCYWFCKENILDEMAKTEGFVEWYLDNIIKDTAGVAGLELIRRIVGMAKVIDITTIHEDRKRARAERICLSLAKNLILYRDKFKLGAEFKDAIGKSISEFEEYH